MRKGLGGSRGPFLWVGVKVARRLTYASAFCLHSEKC